MTPLATVGSLLIRHFVLFVLLQLVLSEAT